jgi:hypothetical protein
MHFSVAANSAGVALPRKILLLPLDVAVYRVAGGGMRERAEDLTQVETGIVDTELREAIAKEKRIEFVALPSLDAVAQMKLDEHMALLEEVAGAALRHAQGSGAWPQKVSRFDYSLGQGLQFLKQTTGADAILFVIGRGYVPTSSSFALGAVALLAGVAAIPQSRAAAVAGVVEIDTGNVLWLNQSSGTTGLVNAVRTALKPYPNSPAIETKK